MISWIEPLALPIQVSLPFFNKLSISPKESRDRDQNATKKMKKVEENKLERKANLGQY